MINAERLDRIQWNSRRGMKELDLMLDPFVENVVPNMSEEDIADYEHLLECSDLELVRFILRRQEPTDPRVIKMVNIILAYHDEILAQQNKQ